MAVKFEIACCEMPVVRRRWERETEGCYGFSTLMPPVYWLATHNTDMSACCEQQLLLKMSNIWVRRCNKMAFLFNNFYKILRGHILRRKLNVMEAWWSHYVYWFLVRFSRSFQNRCYTCIALIKYCFHLRSITWTTLEHE